MIIRFSFGSGRRTVYCRNFEERAVLSSFPPFCKIPSMKRLFYCLPLCLCLASCGAFTPGWEEDYKKQFLETCLTGEGRFHADADAYCACALEKTIARYPDPGNFVDRTDSAAYHQDLSTCR